MNKKALWAVLTLLATASAARAHTSAGCGLGTMLFDSKEKKLHLILAATTNGSFGNQTFGMSSETLGCTSSGGWVKNDKKIEVYAEVNLDKLSREMAMGGGETLGGLATLIGVKDQAGFFKLAQSRYASIFTSEKTDASEMLKNLQAELARQS